MAVKTCNMASLTTSNFPKWLAPIEFESVDLKSYQKFTYASYQPHSLLNQSIVTLQRSTIGSIPIVIVASVMTPGFNNNIAGLITPVKDWIGTRSGRPSRPKIGDRLSSHQTVRKLWGIVKQALRHTPYPSTHIIPWNKTWRRHNLTKNEGYALFRPFKTIDREWIEFPW